MTITPENLREIWSSSSWPNLSLPFDSWWLHTLTSTLGLFIGSFFIGFHSFFFSISRLWALIAFWSILFDGLIKFHSWALDTISTVSSFFHQSILFASFHSNIFNFPILIFLLRWQLNFYSCNWMTSLSKSNSSCNPSHLLNDICVEQDKNLCIQRITFLCSLQLINPDIPLQAFGIDPVA